MTTAKWFEKEAAFFYKAVEVDRLLIKKENDLYQATRSVQENIDFMQRTITALQERIEDSRRDLERLMNS